MEKVKCEHCGKEFSKRGIKSHIWKAHTEEGKNHNPNRGYINGNRKAWNEGLTKENNISLKRTSDILKSKYKSGELVGNFTGKTHTQEAKDKISLIKREYFKINGITNKILFGKKGWYEDYWCDSSWELAFVIYNLEHNIKLERNTKSFDYIFNDKVHLYFPDFLLEDGIFVEIKGRNNFESLDKRTKEKFLQFKEPLKVLYTSDMQIYLDYVIEKYGKNFVELYKDYKKPEKIIKPLTEFKINQLNLIEERKSKILNSGIDFSKYGWVNEVKNLMSVKFNCNKFMKLYLLEFYEKNCFKRK